MCRINSELKTVVTEDASLSLPSTLRNGDWSLKAAFICFTQYCQYLCSLPKLYHQNFNYLCNFPPKSRKKPVKLSAHIQNREGNLLCYNIISYQWSILLLGLLSRTVWGGLGVTSHAGTMKCLNIDSGSFFPSFTSGQGWTLTLCLLYLCSADLGSFPVTIWAWRSFSDNIITKAKKGGNFLCVCVCVFHPHPVLWNSYFRVGVCTWEKLTNLTHSTRTRCHTPMTLKGIHFYICSLNAVLNYFAIVL